MDNAGQHQRLEYIDIAKGIGIICVILGHMDNDSIKQFVFSFHMPLFFMISGFFLSTKGKPRELLRKRVRALLPPYLLTSIALIAMSCLKNFIQILRGKKELFDLVYDACKWIYAALYGAGINFTDPFRIISIGAIWFLLASIVSNYLVAKALQTKYPAIFIIVTAIIGYGTSKIVWLPWSIQAGMTASVFVYMGTLLKKNKHIFQKKTSVTFAGACVLWIIEVMNDWPCLAIVKNQYPNGIFDFIGGGSRGSLRYNDS